MSWIHLGDEKPKARKRHRCFMCNGPIDPGETYVKRTGVRDDVLSSFAMHVECEAETDSWDESNWECFSEGEMKRPKSGATDQ